MTRKEQLDKLEIIIKYCFLKAWLEVQEEQNRE